MNRLDNKGFSLVEVIVASTIWGVVALGVSYGIVRQSKEKEQLSDFSKALDVSNSISNYLSTGHFCKSVLANTETNNMRRLTTAWTDINLHDVGYLNESLITQNSTFDDAKDIQVSSLRFRRKNSASANPAAASIDVGLRKEYRRIVNIEVGLKSRVYDESSDSYIEREYEKKYVDVPVYITKNPNSPDQEYITGCEKTLTQPEICESVGMDFNPDSQTCLGNKDDNNCQFLGSYSKAWMTADEDEWSDNKSTASCDNGDSTSVNSLTASCGCPSETNREVSLGFNTVKTQKIECGKKCSYKVYANFDIIACYRCDGD